jgi:hypothetical protein
LQIEGPKLKLFKAFCKNFHSIESKGFSKSTNNNKPSISFSCKDRQYMSNWRPISLLNTDLKIASAAIANRFKHVLGGIISDTQKGFIKDRFMGENTRLLILGFDLICKESNSTPIINK